MLAKTAGIAADAHDPLDPRVAVDLQFLRDQLMDRLSRQHAKRQRLRRDAGLEAVIGLFGGLVAGASHLLQLHPRLAALVLGTLALMACTLSAFDMRRVRALDVQIRSTARVVASLL